MAEVVEKRSDLTTATPMMKQYLDVRAEYEGHILFYRLGDFYECFFEDAVTASRVLELTLTSRDWVKVRGLQCAVFLFTRRICMLQSS